MRHPTLILLRLSAVLSVNYLICRRIRCCLPKPAEIEINALGALVVISVGRASCARSVKHSSLWNLSSNERDFFFFFFFFKPSSNIACAHSKCLNSKNKRRAATLKSSSLRMLWLVKIKDKFYSQKRSYSLIPFDPDLLCGLIWSAMSFPLSAGTEVPTTWRLHSWWGVCVCILAPPAHKSF